MNELLEYMESLFVDDSDPSDPIQRLPLGLHSFDHAFVTSDGEIGMPIGTGYEVFGVSNLGKSTFCYSLMGLLGKVLETNIVLADLEGFDSKHFAKVIHHQGFDGKVRLVTQGSDEEILEELQNSVYVKDQRKKDMFGLGMLDSIGSISPRAEADGSYGEANMGRRAILMAQLSRRLLPTIHPRKIGSQKVYFFTNHWYDKVAQAGWDTPGGEVKKYLCGVRLLLKRKKGFKDGSYIITGRVYKNRYGIRDTTFSVFMKSGVGIHKGLTALVDCVTLKKAKDDSGTITLGDQSFGKFIKIIENEWENDEFFQPFYEALGDENE